MVRRNVTERITPQATVEFSTAAGCSSPRHHSSDLSRVLLVDDHAAVRCGVREILSSFGTLDVCGEAESGEEALRLVRLLQPDLAIVDVALNDCNGLDLTAEIREISPATRVLIYSFQDESLYADRALRMGASGYLAKDRPAAELRIAVERVLQGRLYLSHDISERLLIHAIGLGGSMRQAQSGQSRLTNLSDRELEVFDLLGHGLTSGEIAERMDLKQKTIETYREKIKKKLGLANGNQLIQHAVKRILESKKSL